MFRSWEVSTFIAHSDDTPSIDSSILASQVRSDPIRFVFSPLAVLVPQLAGPFLEF